MRCFLALPTIAALLLATAPGLAGTQPRRASPAAAGADQAAMCRAACLSTIEGRSVRSGQHAARICELRCGAAASFLAQQNRRGTAEATGRGRAASPAPLAVSMGIRPPAAALSSRAVIYGGRAPSRAFGMSVGTGERLAMHREAERLCAAGGQGCRVVAEFSAACGAVAQAVKRSGGALFITADPASYVVTSLSASPGATQRQAEGGALAECRSRDRGATCRIVASACGTRGVSAAARCGGRLPC